MFYGLFCDPTGRGILGYPGVFVRSTHFDALATVQRPSGSKEFVTWLTSGTAFHFNHKTSHLRPLA